MCLRSQRGLSFKVRSPRSALVCSALSAFRICFLLCLATSSHTLYFRHDTTLVILVRAPSLFDRIRCIRRFAGHGTADPAAWVLRLDLSTPFTLSTSNLPRSLHRMPRLVLSLHHDNDKRKVAKQDPGQSGEAPAPSFLRRAFTLCPTRKVGLCLSPRDEGNVHVTETPQQTMQLSGAEETHARETCESPSYRHIKSAGSRLG